MVRVAAVAGISLLLAVPAHAQGEGEWLPRYNLVPEGGYGSDQSPNGYGAPEQRPWGDGTAARGGYNGGYGYGGGYPDSGGYGSPGHGGGYPDSGGYGGPGYGGGYPDSGGYGSPGHGGGYPDSGGYGSPSHGGGYPDSGGYGSPGYGGGYPDSGGYGSPGYGGGYPDSGGYSSPGYGGGYPDSGGYGGQDSGRYGEQRPWGEGYGPGRAQRGDNAPYRDRRAPYDAYRGEAPYGYDSGERGGPAYDRYFYDYLNERHYDPAPYRGDRRGAYDAPYSRNREQVPFRSRNGQWEIPSNPDTVYDWWRGEGFARRMFRGLGW